MTLDEAIQILREEEFMTYREKDGRYSVTSPGTVWFRDGNDQTVILFAMGVRQFRPII